ncbi:hypothetical protein J5J86_01325 [Aquabacter sp. L1I39]|uniref:hypothetical protein n=1 Tax=Aquabacter sp. L1I39 TaxID=2820278 RepID=UPI001AD9BF0E|nr:hypothetical protein [Aquabacter sp. L1I39]QTL04037.1 hypothetical protein J5J86_01325 [Aquabacter sp. L1I39]
MSIFEKFSTLMRSNKATESQLIAGEREIEAAIQGARTKLFTLEEEMPAALMRGDEERINHRNLIMRTRNEIEDMETALALLRKRAAEKAEKEAEAARQAAYAEAARVSEAAQKKLRERYPKLAAKLVDLIATIAEADALADRVNAYLPSGALPLPPVEAAVRDRPYEPRRILSEKLLDLWCLRDHDRPHPDQSNIEDLGGGKGRREIERADKKAPPHYDEFEKKTFREVTYIREKIGVSGERLCRIELPGLSADDAPYWRSVTFSDAGYVLNRLTELQAERDTHEVAAEPDHTLTELVPVQAPISNAA